MTARICPPIAVQMHFYITLPPQHYPSLSIPISLWNMVYSSPFWCCYICIIGTIHLYYLLHTYTSLSTIQNVDIEQLDLSEDWSLTSLHIGGRTGPDQSSAVLPYFLTSEDQDRDQGQDRDFCGPGPVLLRSVPVFWSVLDWSWDRTLQH